MRAVLIWNSGLVKNYRRREGGRRRRGQVLVHTLQVLRYSMFPPLEFGVQVWWLKRGGGEPQVCLTRRGLIGGVIEEKRVSWGEWQRALRLSLRDIL